MMHWAYFKVIFSNYLAELRKTWKNLTYDRRTGSGPWI